MINKKAPKIASAVIYFTEKGSSFRVEAMPAYSLDLSAIGVVVGRVIDVAPHPDGNYIKIAQVAYKQNTPPSQIIFGGFTNSVQPGSWVAVAPPTKACRVFGVKMRRRKFRGQFSFGELCSLHELGLASEDTNEVAILIPNPNLQLGLPIENLLSELKTVDELWLIFVKPSTYVTR